MCKNIKNKNRKKISIIISKYHRIRVFRFFMVFKFIFLLFRNIKVICLDHQPNFHIFFKTAGIYRFFEHLHVVNDGIQMADKRAILMEFESSFSTFARDNGFSYIIHDFLNNLDFFCGCFFIVQNNLIFEKLRKFIWKKKHKYLLKPCICYYTTCFLVEHLPLNKEIYCWIFSNNLNIVECLLILK